MSQPQEHSAAGRTMSIKNSSNTIRNRTSELPVFSAVPSNTMGTGVKWQGRDNDHAPSAAKVKNVLSYTSNPPYAFMACTGATLHGLRSNRRPTSKVRKGVTCAGRETDGIT
jgi:hypothetical protein